MNNCYQCSRTAIHKITGHENKLMCEIHYREFLENQPPHSHVIKDPSFIGEQFVHGHPKTDMERALGANLKGTYRIEDPNLLLAFRKLLEHAQISHRIKSFSVSDSPLYGNRCNVPAKAVTEIEIIP